jgi:1,4-dihydroxy-2-naphthoate octaprenyltransferase
MENKNSSLFDRDTLLHLRLPFSFFLLPIFLFALSQTIQIDLLNSLIIFFVLHLFIYPASNSYNSFMDNDKGSIGGLKNPPPATLKLYKVSILLDMTGLFLCLLINWKLLFLMLVYIAVSKAYSWKKIRLKKYGITGWLVVMLFQGGFTFLLVNMSTENIFSSSWFSNKNIECMLLASLLIGGFYPLTQIYQHEEDAGRGDYTISYKLGITGTFIFSASLFLGASAVAYHYFNLYFSINQFLVFIFCLTPVIAYFLFWFIKSVQNNKYADYTHAMRITTFSSICMVLCFCILYVINHTI